jgi:hypothetical protein
MDLGKKQDINVQTNVLYPNKIGIGLWNDKIDYPLLQVGNEKIPSSIINDRKHNGNFNVIGNVTAILWF